MAKRIFTQEEIETAIKASANHCAYLMNARREQNVWTAELLISELKGGMGTRIVPQGKKFSDIGSANSLSYRLQNLNDAIHGNPSSSFLHYWTRNAQVSIALGSQVRQFAQVEK